MGAGSTSDEGCRVSTGAGAVARRMRPSLGLHLSGRRCRPDHRDRARLGRILTPGQHLGRCQCGRTAGGRCCRRRRVSASIQRWEQYGADRGAGRPGRRRHRLSVPAATQQPRRHRVRSGDGRRSHRHAGAEPRRRRGAAGGRHAGAGAGERPVHARDPRSARRARGRRRLGRPRYGGRPGAAGQPGTAGQKESLSGGGSSAGATGDPHPFTEPPAVSEQQ